MTGDPLEVKDQCEWTGSRRGPKYPQRISVGEMLGLKKVLGPTESR